MGVIPLQANCWLLLRIDKGLPEVGELAVAESTLVVFLRAAAARAVLAIFACRYAAACARAVATLAHRSAQRQVISFGLKLSLLNRLVSRQKVLQLRQMYSTVVLDRQRAFLNHSSWRLFRGSRVLIVVSLS
jgi:hypothetical protein